MKVDHMRLFSMLLGLCALLAAPAAQAQNMVCPGRISARMSGEMPEKVTMLLAVKAPGDREIEVDFRRALFAALRRSEFIMGVPPTHLLVWQGNIARPVIGAAPRKTDRALTRDDPLGRELGEIIALPGMPKLDRETVPLPADTARIEGLLQLRELLTGRVIWNAEVSCARSPAAEEPMLISILINAIVPTSGKTVRTKEF